MEIVEKLDFLSKQEKGNFMAKHKFNDEEVSGALDQAEIDSENEDDSEEPLPAGGKLGKFIQIQRIAFSKQNV